MRKKCKVNDVIFRSGSEARAINLGNKNMKIGIFTGVASVRSKNIFTGISRYPTGKHEIKSFIFLFNPKSIYSMNLLSPLSRYRYLFFTISSASLNHVKVLQYLKKTMIKKKLL